MIVVANNNRRYRPTLTERIRHTLFWLLVLAGSLWAWGLIFHGLHLLWDAVTPTLTGWLYQYVEHPFDQWLMPWK